MRILVGLSGGVDSSVSALRLCQQKNFDVEALFMKNWEEDNDGYCPAAKDLLDAEMVCAQLGIRLHIANFAQPYWDNVFSHFLHEYQAGRTPNPDILCNKHIKFKAFLDHATRLGFDKIALGHYAQLHTDKNENTLLRSVDREKDQTYFLHTLDQSQLQCTLFPIGDLTKPQVRALAKQHNLPTHAKKDSTGICFIGERKFKTFLAQFLPAQPGLIKDLNGVVRGEHDGVMYYTLGQRQGLHIGGQKDHSGEPWYVVDKDVTTNTLFVAANDHPLLYSRTIFAPTIDWIAGKPPALPLDCTAKTRYRQRDQACQVWAHETGYRIEFSTPQRAVTPGQSIVLYQGEHCLGGGIIAGKET